MTLDTSVLIVRPHSIKAVRDFVNVELLSAPDAKHLDSEFWNSSYTEEGRSYFGNAGMQGLDAWFMGYTMGDGPTKVRKFVGEELGEDGKYHEVYEDLAEGSIMLSFDTAYGAKWAGVAASCSDLHAYFIYRLVQRFGEVWWENEYTGEWSQLDDAGALPSVLEQLSQLRTLGDPGRGRRAVEQTRRERAAVQS